jgi:hypothetical protein
MATGKLEKMLRANTRLRRGALVATTLTGSWRNTNVADLEITEAELDEIAPLLCMSGAAALGWHRVSKSYLKDTPSAEVLKQAYRLQLLQASIHEEKVQQAFRLFRRAGVDAILAKGWAAAGLYEQDLRPPGDIDICVRPKQYDLAQEALLSSDATGLSVDLHKHFSEIRERPLEEVFERSRTLPLGEEHIRILGYEDHLALLCIHFLKHGGWRPLWLCDISTAVESVPPSFDWNLCFGTSKTRGQWIVATLKVAHLLLDADLSKCPRAKESPEPPDWMVENVLNHWCNPSAMNQAPLSHPIPMMDLLKRPASLPHGLRQRWPDPILATVSVNGRFNNLPRFPYQIANCLSRMARFLIHGTVEEH